MSTSLNDVLISIAIKITLLFVIFASLNANANEPVRKLSPDFWSRQNVERVSPLVDPFGDQYDTNSGTLSFNYTDIDIPGNFPIKVAINRNISTSGISANKTKEFGNFSLSIPRIERNIYAYAGHVENWGGTYTDRAEYECSRALASGFTYHAGGFHPVGIAGHQYWNGVTLIIPGESQEKVVASSSGLTTSKYHKIECIDRVGGEGFKVTTPNGVVYTFNVRRTAKSSGYPAQILLTQLLVSRVEDKFGNYVTYNYSGEQLSSINSSDGRRISFSWKSFPVTYSDGQSNLYYIDSITANTGTQERTWQYKYNNLNTKDIYLHEVVLPDDRKWIYSRIRPQGNITHTDGAGRTPGLCEKYSFHEDSSTEIEVTDPYGNHVNFEFKPTYHGRTNVPVNKLHTQPQLGVGFYYYVTHNCNISVSLTKKEVTPIGSDKKLWTYKYSENSGEYQSESIYAALPYQPNYSGEDIPSTISNKDDFKTTTITNPNGSKEIHYINRDFTSAFEGKTVAIDKLDTNGNTSLQRREMHYSAATVLGATGLDSRYTNSKPISHRIDLTKVVTINYSESEKTKYYQENSAFNSYGVPTLLDTYQKNTSGVIVNRKKTLNGYTHDASNWHINLPTSKKNISVNQSEAAYKETSYKSISGINNNKSYTVKVPNKVYAFGIWQLEYSDYHKDGNVKQVNFNIQLKKPDGTSSTKYGFQKFENYKRGMHQLITLPSRYNDADTISSSRTIDDNGWITSTTDFNGNTFSYGYDDVGRIAFIESPNDLRYWYDTVFKWTESTGVAPIRESYSCKLNSSNTGCQGGTTRFTKRMEFDSLLRPLVIKKTDNVKNVSFYQNKKFNYENLETFSSYWSTSKTDTKGVTRTYDGLQRLLTNSIYGQGTETRSYLSNNRIAIEDAKSNVTTIKYLAYGAPRYEQPLEILSPENITTSIGVNEYDNVTSVTQSGFHKSTTISHTEYRVYNNQERLCKVKRGDVGQTVYSYNNIGEIDWSAEGTAGGTASNCSHTATNTQKTHHYYDNLGDIRTLDYGDNTPSKVHTFDKNGNLTKLIFGSVVHDYDYNSLNLLEYEILAIDGKSLMLDYAYDGLGSISRLTYPSGREIQFEPNGFGQPTKADTYAKNALYHPTGATKSFTYGNGLVYDKRLDTSQRPYEIKVKKSNVNQVFQRYVYDNNSNLDYLYDFIDRSYDIDMGYDDVDRLISATGKWSTGTISYDGLGNIESKRIGSSTLTYNYDNKNRLDNVTGSKPYDFQYDNRGNVTNNGNYSLTFNHANQLVNAKGNTYTYDGKNRLVKKVTPQKTTYTMYALDGTLYYREIGSNKMDYIYLGNELVAKDDSPDNPPPEGSNIVLLTTPPTSLNGYVTSCYAFPISRCTVRTSWQHSTPNSVEYYELYLKDSLSSACPAFEKCFTLDSSFVGVNVIPIDSWTKVYSGSDNNKLVNTSAENITVKVRACNAKGCSPFSLEKTISADGSM